MKTCSKCNAESPDNTDWCTSCHRHLKRGALLLATPGQRLVSHILDCIVPVVAVCVAIFGGALLNGGGGAILAMVLVLGYFIWAILLFREGMSPGKRFTGLQVVSREGSVVGLGTMFLREIIGKFLSGLVFCLGFLWILVDTNRQGFHDKLGDTYVVKR